MTIIIGLLIVAGIILYKRSTEIITVNPMRNTPPAPPGLRGPEDDDAPSEGLDFGRLINTIQKAAEQAAQEASQPSGGGAKLPSSDKGRAAILALVRKHQFIEAMQLYRRAYGVDLQTAKKAIDKMMLEQ